MSKNPEYFHRIRARGVCCVCRQPMSDEDVRLGHTECWRLKRWGYSEAELRAGRPQLKADTRKGCPAL